MDVWIIIVLVIGIVALVASLTFYIYYYWKLYSCQKYANYWCWTDWTCPGETDPSKKCPAAAVYGCTSSSPKRDSNYCINNPSAPGCTCKLTNPNFSTQCTCTFSEITTDQCGIDLCSYNVPLDKCDQ